MEIKTFKTLKTLCAVSLIAFGSYFGYNAYEKATMSEAERFFQANVEALTMDGEGSFETRYNRTDEMCNIFVGAKGYIKLLGGTIIKAGVDGYVKFDGKVICHSGGNSSCTPVECKDLYMYIFNSK